MRRVWRRCQEKYAKFTALSQIVYRGVAAGTGGVPGWWHGI